MPLHVELKGVADFESIEHWPRIHIEGNGRGQFVAACVARDETGIGNTVGFQLHFDRPSCRR